MPVRDRPAVGLLLLLELLTPGFVFIWLAIAAALTGALLGLANNHILARRPADARPLLDRAWQIDRDLLGPATPTQLWHAPGCPECARTGYAGRTGIYELMVTDDALQRLIHTAADEAALRAHARQHGAHSLRDDGLRLLAEGSTSAEELLRVTRD